MKNFFNLWYIFRNNFPNTCCNWSTYYIHISTFSWCFSRKIIWSIPIINVKGSNFMNNGQIPWRYFYFILFSFDQIYILSNMVHKPIFLNSLFTWSNICKSTVISSLIFFIQIVCEFNFFNKILIILKLSQHQWIVKIWKNCFCLLLLKLFAANSLLEIWEMIQIFHIKIVCEFRFFYKKLIIF